MKLINTFEELFLLPIGTDLYRIHSGNYDIFKVSAKVTDSKYPESKALVVKKDKDPYSQRFIYERDFVENQFTTEFNNKEVGLLMIKQLQDYANKEIENIKAVYLKDEPSESNLTGDIVHLADCHWNKEQQRIRTSTHYEISQSNDYGNSRNSETYEKLGDAITSAKTLRNKGDEYDKSWNSKTEVITKVTTIKEIVRIVRPEEKE